MTWGAIWPLLTGGSAAAGVMIGLSAKTIKQQLLAIGLMAFGYAGLFWALFGPLFSGGV